MNIEILDTGKRLSLSSDFELETEFTSPILSEQGSQSLPVNLPRSADNFSAFGHPERIDTAMPTAARRVKVESGAYQRLGTAIVLDADKSAGISITVNFDEGEFWDKINDVKLNELDWGTINFGSISNAVDQCSNLFKGIQSQLLADFRIFEVLLDYVSDDEYGIYYKLNDVNHDLSDLKNKDTWYEWTKNDNKWINVENPAGYAISPFIKLSALLRRLFAIFGYTLKENPFENDVDLSKICILNNTRDSIATGILKIADIIPTCTANELFDTVMAKFGAVVFVDSNSRTASIKLMRDILALPSQTDLTEFRSGTYKNYFEKGKQLKLTSEKSIKCEELPIPISAATETDTFSEFTEKYGNIFRKTDFLYQIPEQKKYNTLNLYVNSCGQFYSWNLKTDESMNLKIVSSSFFDWDKKLQDYEYLEIKGADEQVPMSGRGSSAVPFDIPAFIAGIRNLKPQTINNVNVSTDDKLKNQLSFAFALNASNNITLGSSFGKHVGLPTELPSFTLCYDGENGLFNHFMKDYDHCLRHGFQQSEASFMLPETIEQTLNMIQPVMIDNQRWLIEKYKIKIGKNTVSEFALRKLTKKLSETETEYDFSETVINQATKYWKFNLNIMNRAQDIVLNLNAGLSAAVDCILQYRTKDGIEVVDIITGQIIQMQDAAQASLGFQVDFLPNFERYPDSDGIKMITKPNADELPASFPDYEDSDGSDGIYNEKFFTMYVGLISDGNFIIKARDGFLETRERSTFKLISKANYTAGNDMIKENWIGIITTYSTYFQFAEIPV